MPTLDFKGKQFIYSHHHSVPFRELEVDVKKSLPAKGKKPDLDDNLIIHGDNLHALKALMPQYAGKVDIILIDPPYNTGEEGWCYNDNVNSPLMKDWLKKTANPVDKEDLQRHDKWLCMMWPRLKLLHELLDEGGFLAVCIDDNEVFNLGQMLSEIFGETSQVACVPWLSEPSGGKQKSALRIGHEYILIYQKSSTDRFNREIVGVSGEVREDKYGKYRVGRELNKWGGASLREDRPEQWFPLFAPDGTEVFPIRNDGKEGRWRWGKNNPKVKLILEDPNYAHWEIRKFDGNIKYKGKTERWFPYEKVREDEKMRGWNTWLDKVGFNSDATREIKEIFGIKIFDTPKPTSLLEWLINLHGDDAAIVLDSFAGSGSTGHAVLSLNKKDDGTRRFILCQIEEILERSTEANKAGFREVIDITRERISRIIKGISGSKDQDLRDGLGGTFTFCNLGKEINIEKIITGEALPDYAALAKYVFYTATGHSLDSEAKPKPDYFVGETDLYEVYLIYKPDIAFLRGNESALNEGKLKTIAAPEQQKGKASIRYREIHGAEGTFRSKYNILPTSLCHSQGCRGVGTMELKDYQIKVLDYLEAYLDELKTQKAEKQDYCEFQKRKGKDAVHPEQSDYCQLAWEALKASMAVYRSTYTVRKDGMGRNIPNVCFKVPTSGGKTLLAAAALQRINQDYFKRNNGFVLWIVPSDTIYAQTSRHLRNKEHPYRQVLDRASGGRTLILEKGDKFTAQDVQDNLCIMLLMLQSSNRQNKDTLKMFQDSGKFESFFPPLDDYNANKALLAALPNLDVVGLSDGHNVVTGVSIKHSLGNVMRLLRPIAIFDEGHRGASQLAQDTVNSFNTSFILELSATPKDHSNALVNIGGQELKKEQMIKLPINVVSYDKPNWQHTLNQAHAKTFELNKLAVKYQADEGKYIRPIMLIKAEPKRRGDTYDHVADIKSHLMKHLNVLEDEIRIKLADNNELGDEDLFDRLCPVRYIITKDALKEGWDCSFAYILAILSNSKSETALTQFIGRVLRQPYAQETYISALNQCYVYCDNADVNSAAQGIKKGLEEEGMGDVSDQIVAGSGQATGKEKVALKRKDKYKGAKIFLPSLNVIRDGKPAPFDYYNDILGDVHWDDYSFDALDNLNLADKEAMDFQSLKVDWQKGETGQLDFERGQRQSEQVTNEISLTLMVSQLMEKVPNAWQAYRIIEGVLAGLREKKNSDAKIALNSVFIIEEIKKDAFRWMLEQSEAIFRRKLDSGVIFLRLLAEPFLDLNWRMADQIEVQRNINETAVTLDKSLFQPQYYSNYNGLEKPIALAINNKNVVEWWHRLAVRGTEYCIQGWKREKVYPDFLVKLETGKDGVERLYFIESKGDQLEGNKDTDYKQKLFSTINAALAGDAKPKGELKLMNCKENISFHMVFEAEWENDLNKLLVA